MTVDNAEGERETKGKEEDGGRMRGQRSVKTKIMEEKEEEEEKGGRRRGRRRHYIKKIYSLR